MSSQIGEKYLEFVNKLDDKTRYWIFGGILLVFFLLDYFILMRPQIATLTKIGPDIEILMKDISQAKENVQKESYYRSEVTSIENELAVLSSRIKSHEEVPLILQRLSKIADDNGVIINNIMPSTFDRESLLSKDKIEYYSLPINIEARSDYHSFGRFLNQIEQDDIIFRVGLFSIGSEDNGKEQSVKLTIKALVFEEIQ